MLPALTLLAITAIAMPGSIKEYIQLLPANVHWMQIENVYLWERHVTIKGFWRLLFQGREPGEPLVVTTVMTYLSMAALGSGLLWAG